MPSGVIGIAFATLLVAGSAALLAYLCGLLLHALLGPLGPLFERSRLKRYEARAREGDRLMRDGHLERALDAYLQAVCPLVPDSLTMADGVIRHHTGLLSRLIAAADEAQGGTVRLLALGNVDRLLQRRSALLRQFVAARQGAPVDRRRQVERDLRENASDLQKALGTLASEIVAARDRRRERYH